MEATRWSGRAAFALLLVGCLPALGLGQVLPYRAVDLGTLGGDSSHALGLNDAGQAVGAAAGLYPSGGAFTGAFSYSRGTMTALPAWRYAGRATAVNQAGVIVGVADDCAPGEPCRDHAFRFDGSLVPLGGQLKAGIAHDINDAGQIVGVAEINDRGEAVRFTETSVTPLGTLGGCTSQALAINNASQIVGRAQTAAGASRAFLFSGNVMTDLGTLAGSLSVANAINDAGQVVGESTYAVGNAATHAVRWQAGVMTDLGTLGGNSSVALDINTDGVIVGRASTGEPGEPDHAFVYIGGVMYDLNDLAASDSEGRTFVEARAINASGQIVGAGITADHELHAVLLTPERIAADPGDMNHDGRVNVADVAGFVRAVLAGGGPAIPAARVFWADSNADAVRFSNPNGSQPGNALTGLQIPAGFALDAGHGMMYWTELDGYANGAIRRARIDGANPVTLVHGLGMPLGLAIDAACEQKLYWTDADAGLIQRANLDGSQVETVLSDLTYPRGVAVDGAAGIVYFTADSGVFRLFLNSGALQPLATGLASPEGIALDVAGGKIYWANSLADRIQRANLDGTDRQNLVTTGVFGGPYGVALDAATGKIYWSAGLGQGRIQRANLDGANVETVFSTGVQSPYGIALEAPTPGCRTADMNADGRVNGLDIAAWMDVVLGGR